MSPEIRERLLAVEIRTEQIPDLRRENKELRLALAQSQQAQDEAINSLQRRVQQLEAQISMRNDIASPG